MPSFEQHRPCLPRFFRSVLLLLLLATFLPVAPAAAAGEAELLNTVGSGPWVVRISVVDRGEIQALAAQLDVWAVYPKKGYMVAAVDFAEYQSLIAAGYQIEVDEELTATLGRPNVALRNQTSGIPGYPCYRTVEETFATAQAIVASHPDLATWTDIGDSWEKVQNPLVGYDLHVLRLTQSAVPGPKPIFFANFAIHAREYTTAELGTRFAEYLVESYGVDADVTWLLDHHEIHLLLQTNPDGRKKAETGLSWRKNTNNAYCSNTNSRGADLNRNWEFQWGCCGGSSGLACDATYRGAAPASEPEIQAVESYLRSIFPDQRPDDLVSPAPADATGVTIDIHSYGRLVLWPWGYTFDASPNDTAFTTLGRKLAFFNGHTPQQGSDLYVVDGGSKDFSYGELGVAGFAFELGTAFFESCNYFEQNILEQNLASLLYAAKVARTPYLTPAGPDALATSVPPQAFVAGDLVSLTATLDDTRFNQSNGTEATQSIAAAEYTVDTPPWDGGATPLAMSAADGSFNTGVEGVTATVDTAGLAVGRHTLFIRGEDSLGNQGAISAVFVHIIDPAVAPTVQGTVLDAETGLPVAATVAVGSFEAQTDAGGFYSLQVPAGTYDVTALASGYQSDTTLGVVAVDFATVTEDFDLAPFTGVLADDVEAGNLGWTAGGSWAITTAEAFSPSHSWTDSPGSLYANNTSSSLTSGSFDLQGLVGVNLTFRHRHDFEPGFDFGRVEVSTNGGGSWTEVMAVTGDSGAEWARAEISLAALDNAADARIRFRVTSDGSVQAEGWYLDDILLRGVATGNTPPNVTITSPANGSTFTEGQSILFTATAVDAQDGDLAASLAWSSSLDGPLGTGASVSTTLSIGTHTVTAAVTDSGSLSGSDAITVTVEGACLPIGASCSSDGDCCSNKCRGKGGSKTCR